MISLSLALVARSDRMESRSIGALSWPAWLIMSPQLLPSSSYLVYSVFRSYMNISHICFANRHICSISSSTHCNVQLGLPNVVHSHHVRAACLPLIASLAHVELWRFPASPPRISPTVLSSRIPRSSMEPRRQANLLRSETGTEELKDDSLIDLVHCWWAKMRVSPTTGGLHTVVIHQEMKFPSLQSGS